MGIQNHTAMNSTSDTARNLAFSQKLRAMNCAESFLSPTAGTPEGMLILSIVERAFKDLAMWRERMRLLEKSDTGLVRHIDGTHDIPLSSVQKELDYLDAFFFTKKMVPYTLAYCCEWIANDPEVLAKRFRSFYLQERTK
jgi:hypothetical protein